MDKSELLALERLSQLSPEELKTENPELFSRLETTATSQLRASIEAQFSEAPQELREQVEQLDVSGAIGEGENAASMLLDSLQAADLSPELAEEARERILGIEGAIVLADPLDPSVPLKDLPLVQGELRRARTYLLGEVVGIEEAKVEAVLSSGTTVATLNDAALRSLVEEGDLDEGEAAELGTAVSLYHLFDGDLELTETVKTGSLPQLDGLGGFRDLAALGAEDWLGILREANVEPPGETDREVYAELLSKKLATLFPSDAFLARAVPAKPERREIVTGLERLDPLFEHNGSPFAARSFDRLTTESADAGEVRSLRPEYAQLKRLANAYPGMGIAGVLDDARISASEKASRVARRTGLLEKVREQNPNVELLALDYTPESPEVAEVDFSGLSSGEQDMVLTTLKAYQRVYAVTGDVEGAKPVLEAGYGSAASIASESVGSFAQATGLDQDAAREYHAAARATVGATTTALGAILDLELGGFDQLDVANTGPALEDYLRKLGGFKELFGSQDYCRCEHCRSILGPAAYFVDLMRFVEQQVLDRYFGVYTYEDENYNTIEVDRTGHALNLKVRRPDLWTLPLTCQNTTQEIPTLDVINEILENYIAKDGGFAGDLSDRAAVEQVVYEQVLAPAQNSFKQPFVLPLERLQIYLAHFERTRAVVAGMLGEPPSVVSGMALEVSGLENDLITQSNTDVSFLQNMYGIQLDVDANTGVVAPFDAQEHLEPMGLSRAELGELIKTRFVAALSGDPVQIRSEKSSDESVQNDVERIHDLTPDALDRMHRFTRLWRRLPWSIAELDLLLDAVDDTGADPTLSATSVERLVSVRIVKERFGVPAEEVCALWSDIPQTAATEDEVSLFDRLFNLPSFVVLDGYLPKSSTSFVHPSFRETGGTASTDNALHRLLAGLRVSDEELYLLIWHLSAPLGLDLASTDENDKGFNLTLANLSLLYRHARLAEHLDLSIVDLFQLMEHADGVPTGHVENLDHLEALLEFYDWWKSTDFTLDDLGFVTGGSVRVPDAYPDEQAIVEKLIDEVEAEHALVFADTVFAFLGGVTEEQSRAIIAANPASIEQTPDGTAYRLSSGFDPSASLTIPAGVTVAEAKVRGILLKHHASEVIPTRLAGKLNVSVDKIKALISMTGADLADAAFTVALQGGAATGDLRDLLGALLPLSVLFRDDVFDADALAFVNDHAGIFAIGDFTSVGIQSVRKLSIYASSADSTGEPEFSGGGPGVEPAEVRNVLMAFIPTQKFAGADQLELARVLRAEPGLTATLQANVVLPNTAPEALQRLARSVELAKHLGVGGKALKLIVSDDYDELAQASDAVLGAFRAKYGDEKEWREKLEPFEDRIRSRKRGALADHLIHSVHPEFKSSSDLYQHFLIDVELEGCARTSRVVAAISSVQLYVHRCLMNLEQDRRDPSDPDKVHVRPDSIPAGEWAWRKNFRVWEANRKVFLHPENYIEPELRDDKTPLFEELESKLLQQEINEQNVLDAYAAYMAGFEQVSRLKIAGSLRQLGSPDPVTGRMSDKLHLFGVTPEDPPTYYYRTLDYDHYGAAFYGTSPWRKIEVQIPTRKVTPVIVDNRLHVFWVEMATMPKNKVEGGASTFIGYEHKMSLKYTSLRLDGSWTAPQPISLLPAEQFPFRGNGVIDDPRATNGVPKYDTVAHPEPKEGYTLTGLQWDQIYPHNWYGSLYVTGVSFYLWQEIDFYERKPRAPTVLRNQGYWNTQPRRYVLHARGAPGARELCYGQRLGDPLYYFDDYAFRSLLLDRRKLDVVRLTRPEFFPQGSTSVDTILSLQPIAGLKDTDELAVVHGPSGFSEACLIDSRGDLLLLQPAWLWGAPPYWLKRVGTTLSGRVNRELFAGGFDHLLSTSTQQSLTEAALPITLGQQIRNEANAGKLDFTGPYGTYYREIFFHIPFLIANHLNSQQRFAAAQRWYQYIFDPTASETIDLPPDLTEEEKAKRLRDRNWRYLEFRNLDLPKLRELLTDPVAIEAYRKDPFNPHAIARLRLGAYQKCIVTKFIDNLLDWGDSLFAQFTTESVNEATLHYIMAADILGKRPAELGPCGEDETARTYEEIAPQLEQGLEFLIELETETIARRAVTPALTGATASGSPYVLEPTVAASAATLAGSPGAPIATTDDQSFGGIDWNKTNTGYGSTNGDGRLRVADAGSKRLGNNVSIQDFGLSLARQIGPVFCVPGNDELGRYWDRVEDRLFKIRNCMDISGVRRQLALFAPEIDPRLLVRARAAGLSIEDVLNSTSGNLPPYRFAYLIEKAKSYAGAVQGFGAALLSALEKKDVEELNRLRTVHQQNLLKLSTRTREQEIDASSEAIASLERQHEAVTYRKGYYDGLVSAGRSPWEFTQSAARHTASLSYVLADVLSGTAGVLSLVPQLGAPTAMKYGGVELSGSAKNWANVARDTARVAEVIAASAGLEAGFERRNQGWEHQVELADHELKQIEKQLEAAKIRKEIVERSLEIHKKTIEQLEEVYEFYGDKFSNLGLYTWLSSTLQRLYREAYNSAYAMARLAEQAFRFERGDDGTVLLEAGYWDASKTGLLAGERLLIDLQNLERRFIETNYRTLEIDQAFSLTQLDPAALIALRERGSCEFEVPELYFDLFYPGQYRRKIKSARLTIPSVTGPYTNVSATLTLLESKLRNEPKLGSAHLMNVPRRRSVSIATSTAQNDAGVFELNFRDDRYMPFEGAGAVGSRWKLSLPKSFRQFDYHTINDVILHISYTAEEDGAFREKVEDVNAVVAGSLLHYLKNQPLSRLFSLRQDFSGAFNRLLRSSKDTPVKFEITDQHLPIFLRGRTIKVSGARLALRTAKGQSVNNVAISVNGSELTGFAADPKLGDLWAKTLQNLGVVFPGGIVDEHELTVKNAGALAPASPASGDLSAVDPEKLADIMLYLEYKVV